MTAYCLIEQLDLSIIASSVRHVSKSSLTVVCEEAGFLTQAIVFILDLFLNFIVSIPRY